MRNHDQKTRDMARSILPSKDRHGASARKKSSARRARARNNAQIGRLMRYLDDLDGFEEDFGRYDLDDTGWDGMVEDRRSADKIPPLMRWAERRISTTPNLAMGDYEARYTYFSRLLGDTLVGRHARGHLTHLFGELEPDGRANAWFRRLQLAEQARVEARAAHEVRARMLADVLVGAGPRRVNARIGALTPPLEEHFGFDPCRGGRFPCGTSGNEPWLYRGDADAWLAVDRRNGAQEIAFAALDEVHAEMFGHA